jgi:PAS domain S-box-containing protein
MSGGKMSERGKTKAQLLAELDGLTRRLADMEAEARRESQSNDEKWRGILGNAPILVALVDRDGRITYRNRAQTGRTVDESFGKNVFDFTHPASRTTLKDCLQAAFDEGRTGLFHSVVAGPDGGESWYEVSVAPLTVGGEIVAATFIASDITDRKLTEQQLSQERNRAQEYLDIAAVILVVLDEHGNIELLNRSGHELLEYEQGTLIGKNWFDLCLPENERERVLQAFRRLMAGELDPAEHFENRIVARSGEERKIAWHNTLLTDETGRRVGTLSSGTDVTERLEAEEALQRAHDDLEDRVQQRTAELTEANELLLSEIKERRRAEEQLRVIYDGMVDGLLIADIATKRLVRTNPSICRMLGYTAPEMSSLSVADIHPRDDLPGVLEKFEAQSEQRTVMAEDTPVLRKDGTVFYADITASPIKYGGTDCLVGFFRDITERKEVGEKLKREHRVLRELLKSQDRERQLIAYEIHDGLAQHLIAAMMHLESVPLLKDRDLEVAMNSCQAGLDMLRKSLAEARRLISGLRPPILDELGVVAAIGHLIHDISAQGGPKVEYRNRIQFDRLEPVLENAVYRVVQECLTNAHRYSKSDTVRIDLVQHERRLRIEVKDWGIGFDPKAAHEGRFGLEGIKERARLFGGHATVTSSPGEGTQIVVDLPLVMAD